MSGRHYLTTRQARNLDELWGWYDRLGRKLRLWSRSAERPKPQVNHVHWGKLDANLEYDDTTGVTVSIWSGNPLADSDRDIENVLPPPLLTEGQLDSGDYVKIERIDGNWYVTGAPC